MGETGEFVFNYMRTYDPLSVLSPTFKWILMRETVPTCLLESVLVLAKKTKRLTERLAQEKAHYRNYQTLQGRLCISSFKVQLIY